jgi:hypothetical protein
LILAYKVQEHGQLDFHEFHPLCKRCKHLDGPNTAPRHIALPLLSTVLTAPEETNDVVFPAQKLVSVLVSPAPAMPWVRKYYRMHYSCSSVIMMLLILC